ncbi:uncharacterized protein LOC133797747 [Humulus lupulus]|uniref:uncharacterized protein LOC133797747 n=1 Tax=Humulus lupulus TaxID=3486 RepID=UPI002B409C9D|nr:uncharacterized protein LOC133797747 [Humulus lupulus]
MGNCFAKPKKLASPVLAPVSVSVPVTMAKPKKKSTAEIVPHDHHSTVRLYGTPISSHTAYIRFALQHKGVPVRFTPSISDPPLIEVGAERVSGSRESLLQYIESKFPNPPLAVKKCNGEDAKPWVVTLTALQHRSMTWHVERLLRWSEDLGARGGKKRGSGGGIDPRVGTPRMEVKKFNKSYSQLLELMLEHAQMEERVLFPILNSADPGICKAANEEHARHLPIMNGIKEDIKSIGVLDNGSPAYLEAFSNLSKRLKTLLEHCKEHFVEEEIQVLPYIEATELSKPRQRRVLEQSLDVMQGTHSRLFNFFLEGLLPLDAMQYLDLVAMCHDEERMSSMLQMIEDINSL